MNSVNSDNRILGFIPARGGSKGIPNKNVADVCGKPLIAWSIESALASDRLTDVLVSTDDQTIAEVAKQGGANVPFLRPEDLSGDTASTESAMLHALEFESSQGRDYAAIVLLQPTSPLRLNGTIDRAIAACLDYGYDSLVGVCEDHGFTWRDTNNPVSDYDPVNRPRRQDITLDQKRYRETGSIYVTKTRALIDTGSRLAGRIKLFEMHQIESHEIDTPVDLTIAIAMRRHYHSNPTEFET